MACIAIDCRFAAKAAGLGTYTRGMVPPLIASLKGNHIVLLVHSKDEQWLRSIKEDVTLCEVRAPHYSMAEQVLLPFRLKQLGADVLYCPHFNVPILSRVPKVVTIHDLILHTYPNHVSLLKRLAYRFVIKRAITSAAEVIAVSNFTASDVETRYQRKPVVITEGYDSSFTKLSKADTDAVLTTYGLLGDYFLYVGGSNEHKNLQMLIDAHEASESDIPLVLVSSGKGLARLSLNQAVTVLRDVTSRDLPALYNGAKCFITASLFEGFCLPILEARACGTPVIATNTTAIPEIAGTHALLCEPTIDAFAKAIKKPPTRADAPEKEYSWNAAAKEVSAIIETLTHG